MPNAAVTNKVTDSVWAHVQLSTYVALTNAGSGADTGVPLQMAAASDRTVQFEGTFGAATAILEGSNDDDGTGNVGHFHTLHDPLGNPISTTAGAIFQVSEIVRYVRPRVTGPDGTTSVIPTLLSRSTL